MKILVVFDFDHTVVDENCDIWVIKCLPKQALPDSVESTYRRGQWTEYMGDQGVAPDRVRSVMETIPFTPGMPELLTFISENKSTVDCIIVSDANTMFIEWVLQGVGLQEAVDQVYSNPASISESGYMELRPHHSHQCTKCPVNMCKKNVLETYLSEKADSGEVYGRVFYVGDGGNDLCPALCLSERDAVMPRKGYTLDKMLTRLRDQEGNGSISAKVIPWSSGAEILQELRDSLQSQ